MHYVYLEGDYLCFRETLQAKVPWTAAMACNPELAILVIQSFHHSNLFGGNQFPETGLKYCRIVVADDVGDLGSVLGGGSLPSDDGPCLFEMQSEEPAVVRIVADAWTIPLMSSL